MRSRQVVDDPGRPRVIAGPSAAWRELSILVRSPQSGRAASIRASVPLRSAPTHSRGATWCRGKGREGTSAAVRSGYVAAKSTPSAQPSESAEDRGPAETRGIEDRAEVVYALLEGRRSAPPRSDIPVSGAVERISREQAASRPRPAKSGARSQPARLASPTPGTLHEIDRPVARHLVGDEDVAAPGVQGLGTH